jgi:hypothetical protein
MGGVLKILLKVGQYVYRNSIWIFPLVETAYQQIKKLIKRKKNDRNIESINQDSIGKG